MNPTKVFLREKKISKGRISMYLDFYPAIKDPNTGKDTRREFLGIYLAEKPKTVNDKNLNKELMILAENIRAKRQIEIQQNTYGFKSDRRKDIDFLKYFKAQADKHYTSNGNYSVWISSYKHFSIFSKGSIKMGEINKKTGDEFAKYLSTTTQLKTKNTLSINAQSNYFKKFTEVLKCAFKDELLDINFAEKIAPIKEEETNREFLTLEELIRLSKTNCDIPIWKNAFLFASLTGLRFSDVKKIKWGQIQNDEKLGYFFRLRPQKNSRINRIIYIADIAYKYLGERREDDQLVFEGFKYRAWSDEKLKKWVFDAEINKKVTFHTARHTFATLMLTLNEGIYTVKDLLTHKNVSTTEIYGKILDTKKINAVNKLNNIGI